MARGGPPPRRLAWVLCWIALALIAAGYDSARAVQAFAARLRNQVDLEKITAGVRDTVVATTRVAFWLRAPSSTAVES